MSHHNTDDLDAFLSALESKLRGPFSSLDLAKAVTAASLSTAIHEDGSSDGGTIYLHHVLDVLPRAEKVTQLRCILGLLGLESSASSDYSTSGATTGTGNAANTLDKAVQNILQAAQEDPIYEEWVRVIAGLVEGILFQIPQHIKQDHPTGEDDLDKDVIDETSSLIGPEATKLLSKTCTEILNRVRKQERATSIIDEDSEHFLLQNDADPLVLAPYRYNLLHPDRLEQVIPQVKEPHYHFRVNSEADILSIDSKLELEKAREEQEHQQTGFMAATRQSDTSSPAIAPNTPSFPGSRSSASTAKPAPVQRPKSSMFLPSKKPSSLMPKRSMGGAIAGAVGMKPASGASAGLKPPVKQVLHQRKAGAAQALLAKGRARARLKTGDSGSNGGSSLLSATSSRPYASGTAAGGSVGGLVQKSKMKMIDATEVQGLETKKMEQGAATVQPPTSKVPRGRKPIPMSGSKRKETHMNEKASRLKLGHGDTTTKKPRVVGANGDSYKPAQAAVPSPGHATTLPSPSDEPVAIAAAALLAYQQSQQQQHSHHHTTEQQHQSHQPAAHFGMEEVGEAHNSDGNLHNSSASKQQDWRSMLQVTSNKVTDADRMRVQQFFVQHHNPTPEQPLYKMKLHEARITDPKTGNAVKETYYLELDYSNFTSKQYKKVKRY